MALSVITLSFHKLSIGCASALLLLTASTVTKAQADDWGRDASFTFNLDTRDRGSNSDSGKSDGGKSDQNFDFSFNNWGCSSDSGRDSFGDWGRENDRHHDDFFAFTWKDKDRDRDDRDHDFGWQGWGNCPPPVCSGGNGNDGGNGCTGGNGDPGGSGTPATPEPAVKYLSFIAASAMALLLFGRSRRQRA